MSALGNQPAYPAGLVTLTDMEQPPYHLGITIRQRYAMAAMQGLISSDAFHGPIYQQQANAAAEFGFAVADAMLAYEEQQSKGVEE